MTTMLEKIIRAARQGFPVLLIVAVLSFGFAAEVQASDPSCTTAQGCLDVGIEKAKAAITAAEDSFKKTVEPVVYGMLSITVALFFVALTISLMWELWKILMQPTGGGLEEIFAMLAKKILIAGFALAFIAGPEPPAAKAMAWVMDAAGATSVQAMSGARYGTTGEAVTPESGSAGVLKTWGDLVTAIFTNLYSVVGTPPPPPTAAEQEAAEIAKAQERENKAKQICSSKHQENATFGIDPVTVEIPNPLFHSCVAVESAKAQASDMVSGMLDSVKKQIAIAVAYLALTAGALLVVIFAITIPIWKILLDLIGTQLKLLLGGAVGVILLSGLATDFDLAKNYSRKWFTFLVSNFFKLMILFIVVALMSVVLGSLAESTLGSFGDGRTLHTVGSDEVFDLMGKALIELLFFGLVAHLMATILAMVPSLATSMLNGQIGGSSGFASAAAESTRGTADALQKGTRHGVAGLKTAGMAGGTVGLVAGAAAVAGMAAGYSTAKGKVTDFGKGLLGESTPDAGGATTGGGADEGSGLSNHVSPPTKCSACNSRPCKCGGGKGAAGGPTASAMAGAAAATTGLTGGLGASQTLASPAASVAGANGSGALPAPRASAESARQGQPGDTQGQGGSSSNTRAASATPLSSASASNGGAPAASTDGSSGVTPVVADKLATSPGAVSAAEGRPSNVTGAPAPASRGGLQGGGGASTLDVRKAEMDQSVAQGRSPAASTGNQPARQGSAQNTPASLAVSGANTEAQRTASLVEQVSAKAPARPQGAPASGPNLDTGKAARKPFDPFGNKLGQ